MEPLPDPCDDRVCKDVDPPPLRPLDSDLLFPDPGKTLIL